MPLDGSILAGCFAMLLGKPAIQSRIQIPQQDFWCAQARAETLAAHEFALQAPAELASYGVKERLQTRWREESFGGAAAVAAPSQQQRQQQQQAADGGATAGAREERDGGSASAAAAAGSGDFASEHQQALFALLNSYADLLYPCRPYPTDAGEQME